MTWRPISEAPKDGTWIFVAFPQMPITHYPQVAFWNGDDWEYPAHDWLPDLPISHWMPLPDPPKEDE